MADEEQRSILKQGVLTWNLYRETNPDIPINLQGAKLSRAALHGINLRSANLRGADLSHTQLQGANLRRTNLYGANLMGADLSESFLYGANLRLASCMGTLFLGTNLRITNLTGAHLRGVFLQGADLTESILIGADLSGTHLHETILANVNLSQTSGLTSCIHHGPSIIDMRTLRQSWPLPLTFLQGCGLEDSFIEHIPHLVSKPKPSCFISYSALDNDLAHRLYIDLQAEGIRCWFSPGELKTDGQLHIQIQDALRGQDKLLLILSNTSITRAWTETEARVALEAEVRRGEPVLYPICVDRAPMEAQHNWVSTLRRQRRFRDFNNWTEAGTYQQALKGLIDDLLNKAEV